MEDDAGGSSQDRYESDFINDDGREEIDANKARRLKKGQIDSSEEDEFIANKTPEKAQKQPASKKSKIVDDDDAKED